jgi:4-hydroxy-3-methylbut-2-en-1-yl diphosphate synthase IspG/GcpE
MTTRTQFRPAPNADLVIDGDSVLLCPNCGGNYTHLDSIAVHDAAGNRASINAIGEATRAQLGVAVWKDPDAPYYGDRHTVSLLIECEFCGQTTQVDLTQHKGVTQVGFSVGPTIDDVVA